ncbi:MAG: hypothetical protein OEZ06_03605 [Myxococcales bacterium]|nr:hypothetical protein [Myxococcales bacterium]
MVAERDPARWLDAGSNELADHDELQQLLRAAAEELPSAARMDAIAAQLALSVGGAAAGSTGSTASTGGASGAAPAVGGLTWGKLAALGVLLAGGSWLGVELLPRRSAPPSAPAAVASPVQSAVSTPDENVTPLIVDSAAPIGPAGGSVTVTDGGAGEAAAAPRVAPTTGAAGPMGGRVPAADPLAELRLLERAQLGLAKSPQRALALARSHQRRFPRGQFVQERELILIEAYFKLDQGERARRLAERFISRHGDSGHARKVRKLLELHGPASSAGGPTEALDR